MVKASGLAGGKGVVVANSTDEACRVAVNMLEVSGCGGHRDVWVVGMQR